MKKIFLLISVLVYSFESFAQELNCSINLNYGQMKQTSGSTVDKQYFLEMEKAISNFMNSQRWTLDNYEDKEKIKCNLLINLMSSPAQNVFTGQAQFQVIRPVFNTTYETVTLQYIDNSFNFSFAPEDRQMIFNEFNYTANLTSILAFYAVMAVGVDNDSFSKLGGTQAFDRAFNISNLAGWSANSSDSKSRFSLVTDYRSPIFNEFREGFYNYHRLGLDDLGENPEKSRKIMYDFMQTVKKTATQKPNSIVINSFFDAKYLEIINVFSASTKADRTQLFNSVSNLDLNNKDKYRELLK